ncbi:hypothetical protein [Halarcobacter ebronensis]|uniref:Uncharacterized protein n=1 Tax=Halarcobacter ebronensis TaxID=1462615 RepID=A0A4Q1AYF4_9BACT|nr:hypothetical protein [Halarcobacter ebronensis]QKF80610.1 hypothetical protein AEBR_0092 [Halarcobacter ebronensis]RXK08411.1 hypothetical protein CRV07_01005 [Halarcobacter ebronensis]
MSINEIADQFNIGFFSTVNQNQEHIDLNVQEDSELDGFSEKLKEISSEAIYRAPETMYFDGLDFSDPKNPKPIQIPVTGYFQHPFLDEDGNWDEEAEFASYKEKELAYKQEVIEDWLKKMSVDLQNQADLMKALLAKAE